MKKKEKDNQKQPCPGVNAELSRRQFLFASGATIVSLAAARSLMWDTPQVVQAQQAAYPARRIGQVSKLSVHEPVEFHYPYDHPNCRSFLIKIGTLAGGGVGPQRDIVAFNGLCTHRGGPLAGRYNAQYQIFGPCPLHLTTFDLARHGMVVSGQATQGLPQVMLKVEGDDIFAVGMQGLIFGFHNNLVSPT